MREIVHSLVKVYVVTTFIARTARNAILKRYPFDIAYRIDLQEHIMYVYAPLYDINARN